MRKKTKLVQGVGINDADYVTQKYVFINGKQTLSWICPYYKTWRDMLKRCYSLNYQETKKTYKECIVDHEWLTFTSFMKWMEAQDWIGNHLDKDIISQGNKTYSEDKCVFISTALNCFFQDRSSARGKWPAGVRISVSGKYISTCSNPFTKKYEYLGSFEDPNLAHKAWKSRKHEFALIYAGTQTDERIYKALINRYSTNK